MPKMSKMSKYVEKITGNGIKYTDDFYLEMFHLTHDEGLTYLEAYQRLGFDTDELGERRAVQAGYRASQYALEQFCFNGLNVIDLSKEAETQLKHFGISKKVIDDFETDMLLREKFFSAVLNQDFSFMRENTRENMS